MTPPAEARHLVVTGAAGALGRALTSASLARGWKVTALVRRTPLPLDSPRLEILPWELGRDLALPSSCAGADAVCHLAATIPADLEDPAAAEACFRVNTLGTLQVLEAARQLRIGRVVYASAGNAYAPALEKPREHDPIYPAGRAAVYLTSKIAGEIAAENYRLVRGLATTSLRITSVYGPGLEGRGVVARFLRHAIRTEPLRVHDGGRFRVDLVHADDVAAVMLAAIECGASGIFNVGSGRAVSLLELGRSALRVAGAPESLLQVEPARDEAVPLGYSAPDIDRARSELGFRPIGLEEGLVRILSSAGAMPAGDTLRRA